jgi:NADPH:quinone reductase-like Zn-dependent oxidoreductase
MKTMKAVRIHHYGGPEVLRYEEAPRPEAAAGEALVRVHAAGVNPVDWKIREGLLRGAIPHAFPLILGWDLSGTVEGVGAGVEGFGPGDEVYGHPDFTRNGAYAEYIVVRAGELALKPRSLDHRHAAAVPVAALTAWQALLEPAGIGLAKGQRVLIHGGAGGVGHFAVQLAKWRGAKVIATGSPWNKGFLRELGADEFVDRTGEPFEEVVRGVDAVLDTVGGETQARSWEVLRPGGVLASIVSPPSEKEARARGVRAAMVFGQADAAQLDAITRLIDEGLLRVALDEVLPLAEARQAQELSEAGHVRGKLVLEVV